VASRPAVLLVLLPSIGTFMLQAARLARVVMDVEVERSVAEFVARGVTVDLLRELDRDRSGAVERHEFLAEMLVHTGKVERADVLQIEALFRSLDRDGKGKLDEGDLRAAATPGPKPILGNESRGEALGGPILGKSSGSVVTSSTTVFGWTGMDLDSESAERDSSSEGDSSASGLLPEDVLGVRTGSRTPWQRSIQRVASSIQRASVWLLGAAVGALPSSALKAYFELRLSLSQLTTVKLADAGVAAGSLTATVWVLHALDEWGGLRPLTFFSTPMLADADTTAERFNLFGRSEIEYFPQLVDGVGPLKLDDHKGYGRGALLLQAAMRAPRSTACSARTRINACSTWDCDVFTLPEPDQDGNTTMFNFFE
jgi:hypothetical protein